jgi:predicted RNA-binding protein with PIN domain
LSQRHHRYDLSYFFIDGYNLLFYWSEESQSLQLRRNQLVAWIQQVFHQIDLKGTIVFDGAHRREEEYGLSYPNPMEVAYTPKGQSADQYIVEQVELPKNKEALVVVTNDGMLRKHVSALGVKTMSNQTFLEWVMKKRRQKKNKKRVIRESDAQIERLVKIFEERLKDDLKEL